MQKVILQQSIESLGEVGEIVNVKDGYARNYLLPRKMALLADESNIRQFKHQKKLTQDRMKKSLEVFKTLAEKIASVSCTITRKAGEEDKLFGSVSARDIEEALKHEDIIVERRWIQLAEPIRILGVFTVPVKLHKDISVNLKVWVVKED